MNQHLGATYALSVLVVISSAIAFYRADGGRNVPRPSDKVSRTEPVLQRPRAEPASPTVARAAVAPPDRPAGQRQTSARLVTSRSAATDIQGTSSPSRAAAAGPVAMGGDRPRGGFTRVGDGESLVDVSRRLYGSPDRAAALWRANRDQLPSPSAPLEAGMMLRTP
jgi:hypothetical protein